MSNKKEFFSSYAPRREAHKLPDGKEIEVHGLGAKARFDFRERAKGKRDDEILAIAVALGCEMFADEDIGDLMEIDPDVLGGLAQHILRLSGLAEKSKEDAKKN